MIKDNKETMMSEVVHGKPGRRKPGGCYLAETRQTMRREERPESCDTVRQRKESVE